MFKPVSPKSKRKAKLKYFDSEMARIVCETSPFRQIYTSDSLETTLCYEFSYSWKDKDLFAGGISTSYGVIYNNGDFEDKCNSLKKEVFSKNTISYQIRIQGMINDIEVDESFSDLNKFYKFFDEKKASSAASVKYVP